ALRWLGRVRGPLPIVRQTLDPECRRRISCRLGGHGSDLGRYRPVRIDRGTCCGDGERPATCFEHAHWGGGQESASSLHRVSKRRVANRPEPVVGDTRQRKGSRMMRKTFLVLLGGAAGAALTLFATQSSLVAVGATARAASADTYRQLNLFGDIFER